MSIIENKLNENNFNILSMENDPDTGNSRLEVNHNLHPEDNVIIDLIVSQDGSENIEMQFTGPDVWTDEEATGVLQEVMDVLVDIIKAKIGEDEEEITEENQDA